MQSRLIHSFRSFVDQKFSLLEKKISTTCEYERSSSVYWKNFVVVNRGCDCEIILILSSAATNASPLFLFGIMLSFSFLGESIPFHDVPPPHYLPLSNSIPSHKICFDGPVIRLTFPYDCVHERNTDSNPSNIQYPI
jgi:hypothetical protein